MKKRLSIFLFTLISQAGFLHGQQLNIEQTDFLQKNLITICSDTTLSNADWEHIGAEIGNKKIVMLGEFNHGSKEIFLLRNDLIKYLHEEKGFNIVLFESGIGELAFYDFNKNEMTPTRMTYGLFGVWRTKEFRDLMEYIKVEKMSMSGFDIQRTGGAFKHFLKEISNPHIDSVLIFDLEKKYGIIKNKLTNKKIVLDSVQSKTNKLINDFQRLLDLLDEQNLLFESNEPLFASKTIENRINYLKYMLEFKEDRDWHKRWVARDSAMANNINWLYEKIYKQEKIIVIAHNFHISKYNETEEVMGEYLINKYGSEIYSIGVFAGTGEFKGNYGNEEKMAPADSVHLDIKHIVEKTEGFVSFIKTHHEIQKGSEMLHNKITVNDTFIDLNSSNKMVLSKHFDGLLFIDRISPPDK